ncbi:hypothetical protein NLJ89_g8825 [Agrocybe chaxingu]|uniref:Adenylyl-sulfate kinase n=1 Tax=Agrocybe chaxingu TaxID=84603 RepID=A0A9W8JUK9_9AGAR|nr:hypothetical protein NLJ89_g8825 [Agrocybe chaxingu]
MFSIRSLAAAGTRLARHASTSASTTTAQHAMQIIAAANLGRFPDALDHATRMKAANVHPDSPPTTPFSALLHTTAAGYSPGQYLTTCSMPLFAPIISPFCTSSRQAQRRRPTQAFWNAIQRMHEFGVTPTPAIYAHIIDFHVQEGNLESALQLLLSMKKHDLIPELSSVHAVVSLAAECGYSRLAIELATYFEHVSLRRLGDATWIQCLSSSAEHLYMDGVLTCWPIVTQELNILPPEGLCLSVLSTAARCGLPDLATDVLRALKAGGVPWQEHHFASLIEAFCRNNQLKEALVTLHIMRSNDIEPTHTTASFVFETVKSDVDSLDSAWAIIDDIHSSNSGLDNAALRVIIQASIFLGDLQRAVGIYKSFSDYGLAPDLETFHLLLDGCIAARHRQLGDILLADIKEAKLEPDVRVYEKMIQLCLTQDIYEDAFFYLEEMKAAKFVPPRRVYEALLKKCSSVEDPRGEMVLQEMKECRYEVDSRSVTNQERTELLKQRGATIWLTGLSASGKSTIACALEQHLLHLHKFTYRLDGDNVRFGLNKDLGFDEKSRNENIRRIGEVAKLFADGGCIAVTAFISPYRADRDLARQLHAQASIPFVEVFVDAPLEVVEERDPKGLYKKARAADFTGISAPYEAPPSPEIHIKTNEIEVTDADGSVPSSPSMSLVVPEAHQQFQHILRLLNTNVDGKRKIMYALTEIKGVGRRYSNLVCKKADVDLNKRAGDLNSDELERLVTIIQNPTQFKIPTWFLNRQKDIVDGKNSQILSNAVDSKLRDDLERLKKIRAHRGLRHFWGLRVRGQHTKTTGRRGKTVGVSKKRG